MDSVVQGLERVMEKHKTVLSVSGHLIEHATINV